MIRLFSVPMAADASVRMKFAMESHNVKMPAMSSATPLAAPSIANQQTHTCAIRNCASQKKKTIVTTRVPNYVMASASRNLCHVMEYVKWATGAITSGNAMDLA